MAVAVQHSREAGLAIRAGDGPVDPLARALADAQAQIDQHSRALARIHQQLRATHQAYLARLHDVDARLIAAAQTLDRATTRRGRGSVALVALDAVACQEQVLALRQEQEWLAERLIQVAAAARRVQAVARQAELAGGFLRGEVAEGDGEEGPGELAQLQALQAQEDERRRLAGDVHDGPAQVLANAIFELGYCKRQLGQDPTRAEATLDQLEGDLRGSLAEVRQFIHDLQPGAIADLGLAASLQKYLDAYAARARIDARLEADGDLPGLPAPIELGIFRIVQEALQNARKHSRATRIAVHLAAADDALVVTVRDDGVGFDPAASRAESGHYGLAGMADRARLLRAQFDLASSPGHGTTITLTVPTSEYQERESENGQKRKT